MKLSFFATIVALIGAQCSSAFACDHHDESRNWAPGQAVNERSAVYQQRQLAPHWGQRCGTPDPTDDEKQEMTAAVKKWNDRNHGRSLADTTSKVYVIKTYFHVIEFNETLGALNRTEVKTGYIDTLNANYATTNIQFKLAGYDATVNKMWYHCGGPWDERMKKHLYVPGTSSLNVYLCDSTPSEVLGNGTKLLGYSNPPTWAGSFYDGAVIINTLPYGADTSHYTLVHEVGHWLGLFHTFEGGCSNKTFNYDGFHITGDGVRDTPAHAGPTENYPGREDCWISEALDTCNDTAGVDPGLDPIHNHMNYVSTRCKKNSSEFTPGQAERMLAMLETYRVIPQDTIQECAVKVRASCGCKVSRSCVRKVAVSKCHLATTPGANQKEYITSVTSQLKRLSQKACA